jgi:1-phosphofructokinase family hexose kinase
MLTEINDVGEAVTLEKQQELLDLVNILSKSASMVIISGSLPKGVNDDYYLKLCNAVQGNAKKIVDTEGKKLVKTLSSGIYMVKPNLRELEQIVSGRLNDFNDMKKACNTLIDKGAENVLLSLGRDGAILTDGTNAYFCKSEAVAVNSAVGAGDSMVAAVSVMTERGESKEEILRSAVAAGTASIMTPGTNLFYRDKYEEIYSKIKVQKI